KGSILGPLVQRFRQGELKGETRTRVAELIGAAGAPADLRILFDQALASKDPSERGALLGDLAGAARARPAQPEGDLEVLTPLVSRESAAARLAGLWKLASARPALETSATDRKAPDRTRETAIAALADLGGPESLGALAKLAGSDDGAPVRARAVAAMT